ncbi:hypothetical protein XPN_1877, partial [Xanthomonas arboricola pv. pruni MAFF 301427]
RGCASEPRPHPLSPRPPRLLAVGPHRLHMPGRLPIHRSRCARSIRQRVLGGRDRCCPAYRWLTLCRRERNALGRRRGLLRRAAEAAGHPHPRACSRQGPSVHRRAGVCPM